MGGTVERRRPWSALLRILRGPKMRKEDACGGTLINHRYGSELSLTLCSLTRYVLTAAHCLCATKAAARRKEGWCNGTNNVIEIDSK